MKKILRFVDSHKNKYDDFTLSLSAGYIDDDGIISNQQKGIEDTFSIGMPVYSVSGEELGRLSIGLYKNLNYSEETEGGLNIPVMFWRIDGYRGKSQKIKTYHQIKMGK